MDDLILKNGKLITGSPCEIAIKNGKISEVATEIFSASQQVVDLNGAYLSAGWIDGHVHCYEEMELYFDFPDEVGVTKGVTTIIDAGTIGSKNIGDFYQHAKQAKTNVRALVNISEYGIVEQDELADLSKIQGSQIHAAIREYPEFIIGLKARMSKSVIGRNGMKPLVLAKEIQKNIELPLMVHIGSNPPELTEILDEMEAGDILTHCFNGKKNGVINPDTGTVREEVWEAYRQGIIFDVGHGTDSFNFNVAKQALEEGIQATTISTDIYSRNRLNGPVYDLATTMEKMRYLGYSWKDILEKVTSKPAEVFHLSKKGKLEVGYDADITVFEIVFQEKQLIDSNGNQRLAKESLRPVKTIIGGKVYDNEL